MSLVLAVVVLVIWLYSSRLEPFWSGFGFDLIWGISRSDRIALSAGFHWLSLLSLATYRRFIANPLLVFYVSNEVEREESDKSVFQGHSSNQSNYAVCHHQTRVRVVQIGTFLVEERWF